VNHARRRAISASCSACSVARRWSADRTVQSCPSWSPAEWLFRRGSVDGLHTDPAAVFDRLSADVQGKGQSHEAEMLARP